MAVWEVFAPLAAGAHLVLAESEVPRDVPALVRQLGRDAVTLLNVVPSLLAAILEGPGLDEALSVMSS